MTQRPIRRIVPNELFGRARAHNEAHPEPTCLEVVCGDPNSLAKPGQHFGHCVNCLQPFTAKIGEARSMQVCTNDSTAALGRVQRPLGVACSARCSAAAWARFKSYYEEAA